MHDGYATDPNELTKVLADNFSGYLMPAYFNSFDKAQAGDAEAKKAFKDYNEAYQKAKELKKKLEEAKTGGDAPDQTQINEAKTALEKARTVIDKYATNTSRLSAAVFNDLAIKNSPAYKNASADDASADAKAAKDKYDKAVEKLHQALNKQMPKDKQGDTEIPTSNTPDANIDVNNANALDNIQAHAQGEPLDRDITSILKEMNDAAAELNKFATKTDDLLKSVNEHDNTQKTPAFKNANQPDFKQADGTTADDTKNNAAKAAVDAYGEALNEAKELLKNPAATQKEVNDAKDKLDNARKELEKYTTDTAKLVESVKKHGNTDGPAATEGTQTSDAYRNASDPHFMKEEGGKLVPDTDKNDQAAAAKKAYDEALTKAQELLKKHDSADTPQDAKPTQKEINDALKNLDEARKKLEDNYKTVTTDLEKEINKSTAEHAPAVTENDFENTPEFQNADAKKKDGADGKKVDNDDVKAYKDALAKARKLAQDNTSNTLSDHPTQKQIDDALEALKKAKQAITDGYKTDVEKLKQAKQYAEDVFKKTPEYKNATAIKDDTNNAKHEQAGKDLGDATKQTGFEGQIAKIAEKLKDTSKLTQREVDALVKQLKIAQKNIADNYKTNVDKLNNEVGDKDQDGKPVTPPFEASVPYKNALEKAKTEADKTGNDSATKKLEDYNKKLKDAQDLIAQVNSTDPNADPDKKPTQAQVDAALKALQEAKNAIKDAFKTNAAALKKEAKELKEDGGAKEEKDKFEKSTEYQNALKKKTDDGKDNADVTAYKEALKKANELLNKFDENGNPKPGEKDIPSQQEVDEAQKALKEIKDKILANYKTSPHDLQQEVDKSKNGDTDTSTDVFENTPAFKNATAKGDDASKQALKDYNDKLDAAKKLLDKFDRTTGKLKQGETAPTQKELDDALDALKASKKKITDGYKTNKSDLNTEAGKDSDFIKTPEYVNAQAKGDDASKKALEDYKKALEEANTVLGDENATQADVDAALKKLQDAKSKLSDGYKTDKSDLTAEAGKDSDFTKTPEYQNAQAKGDDASKKALDTYKKALGDAKQVLGDKNATQAQVDEALKKLQDAKSKLTDGYKTNKSDLNTEAGKDSDFTKTPEYQNAQAKGDDASKKALDTYKKALEDAKKVLGDANATQAQVNEALKKLQDAKSKLSDGYKTNKSDLTAEAGKDSDFTKTPEYQNAQAKGDDASKQALEAYKKALEDANKVLGDKDATQAQVDDALKKLQDAKSKLTDGYKTNKSDLNTEAGKDSDFTKTPDRTSNGTQGNHQSNFEHSQLQQGHSTLPDTTLHTVTKHMGEVTMSKRGQANTARTLRYKKLPQTGSGMSSVSGLGLLLLASAGLFLLPRKRETKD